MTNTTKNGLQIHQSPKCLFYKTIKESITLEKYLLFLPFKYRKALTKFRMSNHNLPIETGRHRGIPREKRICPICNLNSVGDEFHYITQCPYFQTKRKQYLGAYSYLIKHDYAIGKLFQNKSCQKNLGRFVNEIMSCMKVHT